jgi:multicomponent Na+:H+ antiporter subunit F
MNLNDIHVAVALVLLATMSLGLVRVTLGPTPSDRLMAVQLLGTSGIGVLLVLTRPIAVPALVDVALVFALLAAVAVIAFTRRRAGDP